ncbi:hypothetical protein ONZ51_g2876 [Trametes cubensis]|uniref:Zn(2)-C6 fungal-type domain-containing protein n=1 Tax=Trametes cubensis TaxID=1111947 RepID=A0AAD7XG61_9APHY|nr:hypothetical protein ONZ51_g2876 [Trametes cubensis]
MMSLSPTATSASNDYDQHLPNGKRRRTASFANAGASSGPAASNGPARSEMGSPTDSVSGLAAPPTPGTAPTAPTAHIPKRGARACTNCRKGKNRCEGEVSLSPALPSRPPPDHLHLPWPASNPR